MRAVQCSAVRQKRVLLRADLDVPLKNGRVADDFRIQKALPTIEYLLRNRAKVIVIGHLGRPGGRVVEELRLKPVVRWFEKNLDGNVSFLENLRFDRGEEENDPEFAGKLASLADIFVNDCFSDSHRKHASIVGVPRFLLSFAGLELQAETAALRDVKVSARRPLLFIVGGAKSETKAPLVVRLSKIAEKVFLGGTLMFEKSLKGIPNVVFPVDAVGEGDIGPKTAQAFVEEIHRAGTVVWNGPLGVFLKPELESGTRRVAEALAESKAFTVAGGGDTIAALKRFGLRGRIDLVVSGGGAMLQFLADGTLPGLEALGWKKS